MKQPAPSRETAIATPTRLIRAAPFALITALSLYVAGRAPQGRKPFQLDMAVSPEDIARSLTKAAHFKSVGILFFLATLAVGSRRLLLAFALTMLVGVGWELAQTTVVGHHARLADLAPNLVAAGGSLVVMVLARAIAARLRGVPHR